MTVTDNALSVGLERWTHHLGSLGWVPRLVPATHEERNNWRLIGKGRGIHWEDLDETERGRFTGRKAVR